MHPVASRSPAILLPALLLLAAVTAHATTETSPQQIAGVTRVEAEELLALVEREPQLLIIDSRIRMDRRQGYIEGSVSLPDTETTCPRLQQVLGNRARPALFYCNGVNCGRSGKAVQIAKQCGHANLYWYRGGFEDWKRKNYPFLRQE